MAQFVLVEASPYRVSDGVQVDVRLAGGGVRAYDHRGFRDWRSGVAAIPRFRAAFAYDERGWTGGAIPQVAPVVFTPASKDYLAELADDFLWIGAPITVRTGDDELATVIYLMEMTGTIAGVAVRDGSITFTITDLSGKLNEPLTTATFAGTGGLEGVVEAEGRVKRRTFGKVRNIEGFVLDTASNVYEFGDPAFPLTAFETVSDIGRAGPITVLASQGSALTTLNELKASKPPSGGCVAAPSIACVKWWTQPVGPLTADLQGNNAGGSNRVAEVASRVVAAVAGSPPFEGGSYSTVNTVRAAGTGIHIDSDTETVASALDRLLIPMSVLWAVEAGGSIRLSLVTYANPVETLDGQSFERVETYRPANAVKAGYRKNHRVHSDSEISGAIRAADIDDLGALATRDSVAFGSANLVQSDGKTIATQAAFRTAEGQAASIVGQASTATNSDFAAVSGNTKPEAYADVTSYVIPGVDTLTLAADSTGVLRAGELPRTLTAKLVRNGATITSGIAWTWLVVNGTVNGITGPSAAQTNASTGILSLNINSLGGTSGRIRLIATVGNAVRTHEVPIIIRNDIPPTAGGTPAGASGTTSSISTFANTTAASNTYGSSDNTMFNMSTGGAGTITFAGSLEYHLIGSTNGSAAMSSTFQYRAVGAVTWIDVGAEKTGSSSVRSTFTDAERITYSETNPGYVDTAQTLTGLTANTTYEIRLRLRDGSTSRELGSIFGTASATGS